MPAIKIFVLLELLTLLLLPLLGEDGLLLGEEILLWLSGMKPEMPVDKLVWPQYSCERLDYKKEIRQIEREKEKILLLEHKYYL